MIEAKRKYYHSIDIIPDRCVGEMNCLKVCPVEALRIKKGKVHLIEGKCIDCGECVKVCKASAIVPLTNTVGDFSKFKYTVAIPSIILYCQFDRNIKPRTILSSLKKLGFDEVIDITNACNTVAKAIDKYIKEYKGRKPILSSFCPTCVKLIYSMYPELMENIIKLIMPIELVARNAEKEISKRFGLTKEEIGIIYITPCPSKMVLINQLSEKNSSSIDGVIPISDIYNTLYSSIQQFKRNKEDEFEHFEISGFGLNMARTGGIEYMIGNDNCIAVNGLRNVIYILDEIEKGKLSNVDFVELNACPEGCLSGPMTVENTYIARTNLLNLIKYYGETKIPIGKKDEYSDCDLKCEYNFGINGNNNVDIKLSLNKMLEKKKILQELPGINCGACGAPSCEAFADDVANGFAKLFDCVIVENKKFKENFN